MWSRGTQSQSLGPITQLFKVQRFKALKQMGEKVLDSAQKIIPEEK